MTASDVVLTDEMLPEIFQGLHLRLQETDRYLIGGHTSEPTEHDSCCAYHLEMWTQRDRQQQRLRERRDRIVAAIRAIDPHLDWRKRD